MDISIWILSIRLFEEKNNEITNRLHSHEYKIVFVTRIYFKYKFIQRINKIFFINRYS